MRLQAFFGLCVLLVVLVAPEPGEAKESRDWYNAPGFLLGENVALRWGDSLSPDADRMQAVLDGYEQAWTVMIDDLGYPAPAGCDIYLFNVYYYDTGAGTPPPKPDGGGTAEADPEGYYYVLMPAGSLVITEEETPEDPAADLPGLFDYSARALGHEGFHAVQLDLGALEGPLSGWYWEASAEWMADRVTDEPYVYVFLPSYLLLPHLPLNYRPPGGFQPGQFELPMGHRYGAALFVQFLDEFVGGPDLIRDSFLLALPDDTVFSVLDRLLRQKGTDLGNEFSRFAAHNPVWDYQSGELYQAYVAELLPLEEVARYDYAVTATLGPIGTEKWLGPIWFLAPMYYGYNVMLMENPAGGDLHVEFMASLLGSHNTPAGYGITLVRDLADGPEYIDVPVTSDGTKFEAAIDVPGVGEEEAIYLVIASWGAVFVDDENYPYIFRMYIDPVTDPPDDCPCQECTECQECEDPPTCPGDSGGCATSTPGFAGFLVLLIVFGLWRRRKNQRHEMGDEMGDGIMKKRRPS